jgi:lysozyme family protein
MDATTDQKFQQAILVVLRHEGGYVNDPKDAGGETKYGISKRTYPTLDIKNLTIDQATDIYYRDWWSHFCYNQIVDVSLATKIFDTSVNLGAGRTHKILQRCLKVNGFPDIVDDGNLGPKSISAVNSCDPTNLLNSFRQAQANYYQAVVAAHPEDQKFLKGWLSRAAE